MYAVNERILHTIDFKYKAIHFNEKTILLQPFSI